MAHLNVRERRLETKIAFVGPALSGKGTNFGHLGGGQTSGDTVALFWTPPSAATFRDCTVRVELVTSHEQADDRVRALLREADGVVFVADADPAAQARNKESARFVRTALAESSKAAHPVSLVVQVNKTDLPDALAATDIVRELDLDEFPMIPASALRGLGVVETVELALKTVLERLRTTPGLDAESESAASAAKGPSLPREGNPLLTALRQVLRETVSDQVAELEARLVGRLEAASRSSQRPPEDTGVETRETRKLIEQVRDQLEIAQVTAAAAQSTTTAALRELALDLSSQRSDLTALRDRIGRPTERPGAVEPSLLVAQGETLHAIAERVAAIHSAVEENQTEIQVLKERLATSHRETLELRGDLASFIREALKTLEKRDDMKQLEATFRATATQLGKTVDTALKAEHDKLERAVTGALATRPDALKELKELVASAAEGVPAIAPRIQKTESALQRHLEQGLAAVLRRIDAVEQATSGAAEKEEARSAELQALITALVEELKKPKKGWFS